jgi:hypothetical protein
MYRFDANTFLIVIGWKNLFSNYNPNKNIYFYYSKFIIAIFARIRKNGYNRWYYVVCQAKLIKYGIKMVQVARKCFKIIDFECNVKKAYHYNEISLENDSYKDSFKKIGHVLTLSFPEIHKELKSDISAANPENPQTKFSIVGVIECIRWEGNAGDSIEIHGRFSANNKAVIQEAFCLAECPTIEMSWIVYDFDYDEKKYFKRFYTVKQPLKLSVAQGNSLSIDEEYDLNLQIPINFRVRFSLTPDDKDKDQKLGYAFRAGGTQFTQNVCEMSDVSDIIQENNFSNDTATQSRYLAE